MLCASIIQSSNYVCTCVYAYVRLIHKQGDVSMLSKLMSRDSLSPSQLLPPSPPSSTTLAVSAANTPSQSVMTPSPAMVQKSSIRGGGAVSSSRADGRKSNNTPLKSAPGTDRFSRLEVNDNDVFVVDIFCELNMANVLL